MSAGFARDPGSFRDPAGYVFSDGERIVRSLSAAARVRLDQARASGLLDAAADRQLLVDTRPVAAASLPIAGGGARGEAADDFVEHPRIPLVSYPYEWTFGQLKDAALAHLALQILALDHGFELADGTAYNMQFGPSGPLHIDVLSLRPYREGRPWDGYNQFCRQFLFPLLLESVAGLPFQRIYRGSPEGIGFDEARAVIPAWRRYTSLNLLLHLQLQGRAVRSASSSKLDGRVLELPHIPRARYLALLEGLRDWIAGLRPARAARTYWADYASVNSYSGEEQSQKAAFVARMVRAWGCGSVLDAGGNTGDYSVAALGAGAARACCVDADIDALEAAYARRRAGHPGLLPLVVDWSDPTPAQGWAGIERRAFRERAQADAVLALALVHHIVIGRNVPLGAFVDSLFAHARHVLVEFVPRSDPMVAGLLRGREDVFHDYEEGEFVRLLQERAEIEQTCRIRADGRVLFACTRRPA